MAISKVTTGRHKGEYIVRVQPRNPVTKKRMSIPIRYAKTKRKAEQLQAKIITQVNTGFDYDQADMLVGECLSQFIQKQKVQRGWAERTYKAWLNTLGIVNEYFARVRMKQINEDVMRTFARKFISDRKLSIGPNSVIGRVLVHLHAFFDKYVGAVYKRNPVPRGPINAFFKEEEQTLKKERYTLSKVEVGQLIRAIKDGLDMDNPLVCVTRLAIWVDTLTGMRPQELQALRWSDLVGDDKNGYYFHIDDAWSDVSKKLNGHLKKRKHGESRDTLPISNELKEYLDRYHEAQVAYLDSKMIVNENDFIFLNLNDYQKATAGFPICQTSLNEMLKRLGDQIGIDTDLKWSLYSLRHTVATTLANDPDVPYPWAAQVLGHTVQIFMKTYVHVTDEVDDQMRSKIGQNGIF